MFWQNQCVDERSCQASTCCQQHWTLFHTERHTEPLSTARTLLGAVNNIHYSFNRTESRMPMFTAKPTLCSTQTQVLQLLAMCPVHCTPPLPHSAPYKAWLRLNFRARSPNKQHTTTNKEGGVPAEVGMFTVHRIHKQSVQARATSLQQLQKCHVAHLQLHTVQ
jgi:hypothetical protein